MSSTSAACGFQPFFHPSGDIRNQAFTIASGYAQNIFTGDPVKLLVTGTLQLATSDGTRTGTVAGILIAGIFQGCQYTDSTGKPCQSPFWPTGTVATDIIAWVSGAMDPSVEFQAQYTNPSPGTTVATIVGQQCDWVPALTGSTATGISANQLGVLQTGTGNFQITGFAGNPNDALTDTYVSVTCRINEAQMNAAVAAPT